MHSNGITYSYTFRTIALMMLFPFTIYFSKAQGNPERINDHLFFKKKAGSAFDLANACFIGGGWEAQFVNTVEIFDYDEKYKDLNAAQKLKNKVEIFCHVDTDKKSKGFFTTTYIPLFKQMQADSLLETACYIMYASSQDAAIVLWLNDNSGKVKEFQLWLSEYSWKRE